MKPNRRSSLVAVALLACSLAARPSGRHPKQPTKPDDAPPATPAATVPGEVTVPLGGAADQVQAGAGGRYLVFHMKDDAESLTVVDTIGGKVVGKVPAPGDVKFAADRDKLLVVLNDQHVLQRFDLATLKREQSVLLTDDRPVVWASMGSAGTGPLALWPQTREVRHDTEDGVQLWDVGTLRKLAITGETAHPENEGGYTWASADGRTFCLWGWTSGPYDLLHLTNVTATSVTCRCNHTSDGESYNRAWAMPTADGSMLVKHDAAVYDATVREPTPQPAGPLKGATLLPTDDPRYLVALRKTKGKSRRVAEANSLAIVAAVDRRVLYTINDVEPVMSGQISTDIGRLGLQSRVYYLPADNRIALVPDGDDRVVIRPFDLAASLKATGADYLFVTSKPPATVTVGQPLAYQIEALASAPGQVTYKLEQGPAGLNVSPTGLVTWKSPSAAPTDDPDGTRVPVVVTVGDGSGPAEVTHGFSLRVVPALPRPGGAILANGAGGFDLPAFAAELMPDDKGVRHLRCDPLGYIFGWENDADTARWSLTNAKAGWYAVNVVAGSGYGVGSYDVVIGKQSLTSKIDRTDGDPRKFQSVRIGVVRLPVGPTTVSLHGEQVFGGMMYLRAIHLTPTNAPKPGDADAGAGKPGNAAAPGHAPKPSTPTPAQPPQPPKDPEVAKIGERLAKYLEAEMQADAREDTDSSTSVSLGVGQAVKTSAAGDRETTGRLFLTVYETIILLPNGDVMHLQATISVLLRRAGSGPWTCDTASMVTDYVSGTYGPINVPRRTKNVTRALRAALADVQENDAPAKPKPHDAEERVPLMRA